MNTIKELDAVALTCDLPEQGLKRGDVGTVVLVHGNGVAFEMEFVGYDGHTIVQSVFSPATRRVMFRSKPRCR